MLIVHHLGRSQSERIVWLCEELRIPYELKLYTRMPGIGVAPPEYKALHPMGTAPIITDGTLALAESCAITEYLIAKHNGQHLTVAAGQPNFTDYLYWYHFALGTMQMCDMAQSLAAMPDIPRDNAFIKVMLVRSDLAYAEIEKRLGVVPYLAGDKFTIADILIFFALTFQRSRSRPDLTPFPNLRAYLKRVGGRPAYLRAMEKAEPGVPLKLE